MAPPLPVAAVTLLPPPLVTAELCFAGGFDPNRNEKKPPPPDAVAPLDAALDVGGAALDDLATVAAPTLDNVVDGAGDLAAPLGNPLDVVGAGAVLDADDALDIPVLPAGSMSRYCEENGLRCALPSGSLGATDVPPNPRNRDKLKPPPLDGAVVGGGVGFGDGVGFGGGGW